MVAAQQIDYGAILRSAADGGKREPPLLVIWGPGGIGKTSFALKRTQAPAALAFEVGARSVRGTKVYPNEGTIQTWEEAITYARAMAYGEHSYKTLVLDSLNPMEALCIAFTVKQSGKGSFEKMGWGREAALISELRVMLGLLERCKHRGMQVILTAHDKRKNIKDPMMGEYHAFTASTQVEQTWNAVFEWADIVGFCRDDYGVAEGRAVKLSNTRTLHTLKGGGYQAKQREGYEHASPVPLDWPAFTEALERGAETPDVIISRISALVLDMNDATIADKARAYVDEAKGDVSRLVEIENGLKLKKQEKSSC